jgi:DNA-binding transcriptional regulator YiaG
VLRAALSGTFDFSPFAGVSVTLGGGLALPILRCERCGLETAEGSTVEMVLHSLALKIITSIPTVLDPVSARYLRRFLGATQQGLADLMRVSRETVADWERGAQPISPNHDFILRTFVRDKLAAYDPAREPARRLYQRLRVHAPYESGVLPLAKIVPPSPSGFVIDAALRDLRAARGARNARSNRGPR